MGVSVLARLCWLPLLLRLPPTAPSASQPRDKYLVIGSHGFSGGAGNTLIYYPSVFFFALATHREVLISDQSDIGYMCQFLVCGFRRLSQVLSTTSSTTDPQHASEDVHGFKHLHLVRHFEGSELEQRFVRYTAIKGKYTQNIGEIFCIYV